MDAPTLIDLDRVQTQERPLAWSRAVPSLFPGLTIDELREPTVGLVKGTTVGCAKFWIIDSGPVAVGYSPAQASESNLQAFSLMLQLEGSTNASQHGRLCELHAGDFCLIDGDAPFQLSVATSHSRFLVVQFPRLMVLNRHPHFQRLTAAPFPSGEAGSQLLQATLTAALDAAQTLDAGRQWSMLSALIQSLGVLRMPAESDDDRRVQRAIAFMEARLADPTLRAADVALDQSVSRRHLDRIFERTTGMTVTASLWERRLAHAAMLLRSPQAVHRTVTQIALASGFQDMSHFSRAFKRHYRVQPRRWRTMEPTSADRDANTAPRPRVRT